MSGHYKKKALLDIDRVLVDHGFPRGNGEWPESVVARVSAAVAALAETERERDLAQRQLDAVDAQLPWEPDPASDVGCVGRVQAILNLQADRAALAETEQAASIPIDEALARHFDIEPEVARRLLARLSGGGEAAPAQTEAQDACDICGTPPGGAHSC